MFLGFQNISVQLIGHISSPYETSIASARTCYSGKGIIYPEDVSKDEKAIELRDRIASSTMEAGHLTTRQHAHFVFAMSGVSRQFLWSFLHSHPYYNSEQVSQRYVKVKPGNFLMPPIPEEAMPTFEAAVQAQTADYEKLIEALMPPLSADFFDRFKARAKQPEKWKGALNKRSYEVARYVLGVGTTAYLYHTVSALTLLRYVKLCQLFDTPHEQRVVVQKMLDAVLEKDPLFAKEVPDPLPLEMTPEYQMFRDKPSTQLGSEAFVKEFDSELDGKISKLVGFSPNAENLLAHSVRVTLGKTRAELSDSEAIDKLLDPAQNKLLGDTLNVSTLDKLSQCLHHVGFTFQKKISHTADSQDQRHRTVLSNRPMLHTHYTGKPDYIVPYGITQSPLAMEIYERSMERSFKAINELLDRGVSQEYAFYLLPNAFPIRMISTGDLLSLHHKWKLRACYNAQEEIFRATTDEVSQVKAIYPKLGEHLRAPCYLRLRSGIKPYCPEGDRFCGLPVWKYSIEDYKRKSL